MACCRCLNPFLLAALTFVVGCQQSTPTADPAISATVPASDLAIQLKSLTSDEQRGLREILADPASLDVNGIDPHLAAIARDLCRLTLTDADKLGTRLDTLQAGAVSAFALVPLERQKWAMDQVRRIDERVVQKLSLQSRSEAWTAKLVLRRRDLPWLNDHSGGPVEEVVGLNLIWDPYDLGPEDTDVSDSDLKLVTALPGLRQLDLRHTAITDAGLRHLTGLQQLNTLNLSATSITDEGLKSLGELSNLAELLLERTNLAGSGLAHLAGCTRLSKLTISRNSEPSMELGALNELKSLEALTVSSNGNLDLHDLPNLHTLSAGQSASKTNPATLRLTKMPALQTVSITQSFVSTDQLVIHDLPRIVRLSIYTDAPTVPFEQLSELTNVRELTIDGRCLSYSEAKIRHLSKLHRLTRLHLGGTLDLDCLQHLQELTALRRLAFGGPVNDSELSALSKMKLLQGLTVWNMHGTGQGFDVLKRLSHLKELSISNLDLNALHLVELPLLKQLHADKCQIRAVEFRDLPKLKTVNINSLITKSISAVKLPNLAWLSISLQDADQIEAVSLQDLPELRTLQLTPISNASIESIPFVANLDDPLLKHVAQFPKLESLTFRYAKITEDGVQSLRNSRSLRTVDLTGCPYISSDSRQQLRELLLRR
ncbi:MAG: hypothetical protein JSS49_13550 [Planctomycetes bacterium]|nr:hypothetical protein [Planctomycetota bacterium]